MMKASVQVSMDVIFGAFCSCWTINSPLMKAIFWLSWVLFEFELFNKTAKSIYSLNKILFLMLVDTLSPMLSVTLLVYCGCIYSMAIRAGWVVLVDWHYKPITGYQSRLMAPVDWHYKLVNTHDWHLWQVQVK